MGAGKWRTEYGHALRGARVTIVADNDDAGRRHAREVFEDLVGNHECECRIVETPLAHAKDYSDHRSYGGTAEMLVTTATSVVAPTPRSDTRRVGNACVRKCNSRWSSDH